MRIFLDANVLFSAAKSDGAVRLLINLLLDRGHEIWIDAYVLEEARRNLAAKAAAGLPALDALSVRLQVVALSVPDSALSKDIPLPDKDRPVLLAAVRLGCAALITGDRTHFDPWYGKRLAGVRVYSPRDAAEKILSATGRSS